MTDFDNCLVCNRKLTRTSKKVKCKCCDSFYHTGCVTNLPILSTGAYALCCGQANQNRRSVNSTPSTTNVNKRSSQNIVTVDVLNDCMNTLLGDFRSMVSEMLTNSVDEIKSEISVIISKLYTLEQRVSVLESSSKNDTVVESVKRDLLTEIENRKKHARNIIIYNFRENLDAKQDLINFNDILSNIESCHPAISAFRFGKSQNGNPRPLKLIFKSELDANEVLRCKSKLSELNLTAKNDLTLDQRTYLKKLQQELKLRTSNGEQNLMIKYVDGSPKIIVNSKNT